MTVQVLEELERRRLRALVDGDAETLHELHADDFVLVNPGGGTWSKETYVGGVVTGEIDYRRFEPISPIEAMVDSELAVLRYRSMIEISVAGRDAGALQCWHLDCYRRDSPTGAWRVVWSQATTTDPL
jgi:hypothetical protein